MGRTRAATPSFAARCAHDVGQRRAGREPHGAVYVGGEIAVAQLEPRRSAQARHRLHEGPGLVAPAPAGLRVDEAGRAYRAWCRHRARCEPQVLEVVAGVDDDGEPLAQQARKPQRQLGAADAARERNVGGGPRGSSEQVLAPWAAPAPTQGAPGRSSRARAPGRPGGPRPPRPWPAPRWRQPHRRTPTSVTSSGRPARSFSPRRSHSDGTPAAPMARPTVPSRQALPTLSERMTPISTPKCASSRSLRARALSSGACGSSRTRRPWSSAPRLDWSMPALAITKPWRVATISTLGLARTTSVASDRIASTRRASLRVICGELARLLAGLERSQVAIAALGLGDDLAGHNENVAGARRDGAALERRDQQCGEVVPRRDARHAAERRDRQLILAQV